MFTDKRFYMIMAIAILLPGSVVLYNDGSVWESLFASIGALLISLVIIGIYVFYILYAPDKTFGNFIKSLFGA